MIYKDDVHSLMHGTLMSGMLYDDVYHDALAYLLALDENTRKHFNEIFDLAEDRIKLDALSAEWQTSTTLKICRLAFNLWNGCHYNDDVADGTSRYFSPDFVFDTDYMEYFFQAVRIRFNQ